MMPPTVVTDIPNDLAQILRLFNHGITVRDNLQAKTVEITAAATPDTEFTVEHALGVVPVAYIANVDRAAIVYDSRRSLWTESEMYLKCNVASAVITLTVFV